MFRQVLLVAVLATSVGLFGQNYPSPGEPASTAQPAQPSSPNVIVVPASPSIYFVGGAYGAYGAYLTPLGTLPVQGAGISLAGRAGISLEAPLQTGAITALPSPFAFGAQIYSPVSMLAGGAAAYAGPAETERLINDLGPSYYVEGEAPRAPGPSLGEVAEAYKRGHPRAVRVYTNADAERLSHNTLIIPGVTPPKGPPQTPPQNLPPKPPPQKDNQ